MGLIVVTNPELGWDCVVAVYDDSEVSETELGDMYDTDVYVLSSMGISKFNKPKLEYTPIKEIIVTSSKDQNNIECVIDSLEIDNDYKSLLQSREGMKLKSVDVHILGNIADKFIIENNINMNGGYFCVVTVPETKLSNGYSYLGLGGIEDRKLRNDTYDSFYEELDNHLNELGISLS